MAGNLVTIGSLFISCMVQNYHYVHKVGEPGDKVNEHDTCAPIVTHTVYGA